MKGPLRTLTCFLLSETYWTNSEGHSGSQNWTLDRGITTFRSKKGTNGKLHSKLAKDFSNPW